MIAIDLSGKTAVVTGSATGLGAETARFLARAGAGVVVNYHKNAAGAETVVAEIRGEGGRAIAVKADVSDPDAVAAMFGQARAQLGPVTIVVNNAGREERLGQPFELGWDDYQTMIDMNLKAVYNTVRNAHDDMKAAAWGRVVNIGSIALNRPFPGSTAYVSGKGAMFGITRAMAAELGPVGITVNMIAPGWIPVERHAGASAEALERLARETPLRRIGVPADIAGAVLFFCSELSGFVTGQYLPVSGGEKV
jgi:3-oxoacyl-[acyl-carrier protein] reductase